MNKAWRVALLWGAMVLAFGLMGLVGHGASSRRTLERYKADLRAKGEKLTYVELMRLRVAHANDSLVRLTNAVARLQSGNQPVQPAYLQVRKYVGVGQAQVAWQQEHPFQQGSRLASAQATWQTFDAELAGLARPLAALRQILQDPAADAGPRTNFAASMVSSFVAIRIAAQWLAGAALNEVRQGHIEAALQNLEALGALGRTYREEYTLVAQMIRVAVVNLGLAATWEALQAPGWEDSQLERLQHAWEEGNMVQALGNGFLGERAGGLAVWAMMRRQPGAGNLRQAFSSETSSLDTVIENYALLPAYKLTSIHDDELFFLQIMQESLQAVRLLEQRRELVARMGTRTTEQEAYGSKEAMHTMDELMARVSQLTRSPQGFRYRLSMMVLPNLRKTLQAGLRAETERQMALTAIALRRYHLRCGQWPSDLSALVPQFAPTIGYDPMSGCPLRYRLQADGDFLLYSVGEDGRNDGGNAQPASGKTCGMWEGRDAVWPSVAPSPK